VRSFRERLRRNAAHPGRPRATARFRQGEKADIRKRARENCQLQVARERFKDGQSRNTTGNFLMHKIAPVWKWLLILLVAVIAIAAAFHFDAATRQWVVRHQSRNVKQVMHLASRYGDWPEHI